MVKDINTYEGENHWTLFISKDKNDKNIIMLIQWFKSNMDTNISLSKHKAHVWDHRGM